MLGTRAIVVHLQGKEALVETRGSGGCGHCDSGQGCGSGKLSQLFCSKPRQFKVQNDANASVGDEVQITLPEGVLLRSSVLIYVLPLCLLLGGGMLGVYWASDVASRDGYAAMGSLSGLVSGFFLAKWLARHLHVSAVANAIVQSELD